jgi:hypothetical protein
MYFPGRTDWSHARLVGLVASLFVLGCLLSRAFETHDVLEHIIIGKSAEFAEELLWKVYPVIARGFLIGFEFVAYGFTAVATFKFSASIYERCICRQELPLHEG